MFKLIFKLFFYLTNSLSRKVFNSESKTATFVFDKILKDSSLNMYFLDWFCSTFWLQAALKKERTRERDNVSVCVCEYVCEWVSECVCVCVRERERDASSQNSTSIASYKAASRSLKLAFYRCTPFIVQPHQATQNGVFRYFLTN